MKKLFILFSLVLILVVLIAMPTTASASGSCPLPGSSAAQFCAEQAGVGSMGYYGCVASMEAEARMYCQSQGECCNY